tara:strand:+ start:273 stop:452 length:180 start_codon:yes stop_codon:yes gene_type:complete
MPIFKLRDLIDEIRDGVTISVELEDDFYSKLGYIISNGKGELPVKIKINLDEPVDNDDK